MKKLFSFIVAVFAILMTYAQTGNVGIGTSLPGSKLTINGSFAGPYKMVSTTGNVGVNDFFIAYDGASNNTLTLPAATVAAPAAGNMLGRIYHFKNTGFGVLTIAANGTELIDNQAGSGVANIKINPGYYAMLVSKGTTGAVTTWELALIASAYESSKPQMIVVETTATSTYTKKVNGNYSTLNNDVQKINSIPGARYTTSSGTTPGFVTLPAGTYLITQLIEAIFVPTGSTGGSVTSDNEKPTHSFFYDFRINSSEFKRVHGSATTNFGPSSSFSVQIQYTTTITATRTFPFELGWGEGGNVTPGAGYDFKNGSQLSIMKIQ